MNPEQKYSPNNYIKQDQIPHMTIDGYEQNEKPFPNNPSNIKHTEQALLQEVAIIDDSCEERKSNQNLNNSLLLNRSNTQNAHTQNTIFTEEHIAAIEKIVNLAEKQNIKITNVIKDALLIFIISAVLSFCIVYPVSSAIISHTNRDIGYQVTIPILMSLAITAILYQITNMIYLYINRQFTRKSVDIIAEFRECLLILVNAHLPDQQIREEYQDLIRKIYGLSQDVENTLKNTKLLNITDIEINCAIFIKIIFLSIKSELQNIPEDAEEYQRYTHIMQTILLLANPHFPNIGIDNIEYNRISDIFTRPVFTNHRERINFNNIRPTDGDIPTIQLSPNDDAGAEEVDRAKIMFENNNVEIVDNIDNPEIAATTNRERGI